jgi:hypothetical protein
MSTYKTYVKHLENQVASFNFINDNHLILLKNSLDLSILHNELWERSMKDKELTDLLNIAKKAQDSYDVMFAKYNHQRIMYEHLALETKKLMSIVRAYENEEELLNREL